MILAVALLAGKMTLFNALLGSRWTCTLGTASYYAQYDVVAGNALHGRLYSADSSADSYLGYDVKRKLYWIDEADSAGGTESQTSSDGSSFHGSYNDGAATTKAANTYTITNTRKWTVRARGTSGGQAYDVTATCVRKE